MQSSEFVTTLLTYERFLLTMSQKMTFEIMKASEVLSALLALVFPFLAISGH